MPSTFVQATNGNNGSGPGSSSVTTTAFGSSTTTGNAIIVSVYWDISLSSNLTSVSDNKSNIYTLIGTVFTDANNNACQHAYCLNATGGASHTVTANFSNANAAFVRIVAHEASGIATSAALDQDSGGNQQTSATPAASSVTTTTGGQYIFASVVNAGGTASDTFSAGSGFTEPANSTASAAANESMVEDQVQTSAGAIAPDWTRTSSGLCTMRVSTYKSAGVPPSIITNLMPQILM